MLQEFLQRTVLGNPIEKYCWFTGILLIGIIFKKLLSTIFTRFLFRFLKKYASRSVGFDQLLELLKKPFGLFILLLTLYSAFNQLEFPSSWEFSQKENFGLRMIFFRSFQIAIISSVCWIILRIVDFFGMVLIYKASLTESKTDDQLIPFLKEAVKIIIIIFSIFFILGSVFQLNIASLIAGLGIGGLAIALAAKESLENLLGSFTIFLDKPFVIGDLVKIEKVTGHVEHIGFRSTRIRTLEKSYVTVPNKKMVEAELDNLSLRTLRRVQSDIKLSYTTTSDQLQSIVSDIQKLLEVHPLIIQDGKVRFYEFGGNSLNILVNYFVKAVEWDAYTEVREEINYGIMKIIKQHGSNFAYATTVNLENKA